MQEGQGIGFEVGRYLETLLRQWRLILSTTLICAMVAGVLTYLQPKSYQARVLVASTNVGTNVSLGSTIETLSEEQLGYRLGGSAARLQSYVQMVKNPLIAQSVIDDIGDKLPERLRSPKNLIGQVSGRVAEKSDSIEILVTNTDPQVAVAIANAWGKKYVDWVNNVYSSNTSLDALKAVQQKEKEAQDTYEKAQKQLETFISKSSLDDLTRQVEENKALVTSLSTARTTAASTIISNTSLAQLTSFNEELLNYQELLKQAYLDSRKVNHLIRNARSMRDQIEAGGEGAARSNSLALVLLKTQVFAADQVIATNPEYPTTSDNLTTLQIQAATSELTPEEMVMDLEGLIATLEARQATLNTEIEALSQQLLELESVPNTLSSDAGGNLSKNIPLSAASLQALLNLNGLDGVISVINEDVPLEQTIGELENKISDLQAKLAKETDRQQELTRARDLAWQTYSTLATREAELEIATESLGKEVALASTAGIPERDTQNLFQNVALAGLIGLLFGVGVSYLVEYWWNYQGVQPRPIWIGISKKR
jgi:uncharacterized protein involved in exopolysaccharide biosynthesis